jgi:thiol-disulfide isomerase/thioredoxin
MRNIRIVVATLALAFALAGALAVPAAAQSLEALTAGGLIDMVGKSKGKVVVVNFWATWCAPCKMEIPQLIKLRQEYDSDTLELVGVSMDKSPSVVRTFAQRNGINYPLYMATRDLTQAFGVRFVPTTIVYGPDGSKADQHIGYASMEDMKAQIDKLLR